jgi:hypothetical protein
MKNSQEKETINKWNKLMKCLQNYYKEEHKLKIMDTKSLIKGSVKECLGEAQIFAR